MATRQRAEGEGLPNQGIMESCIWPGLGAERAIERGSSSEERSDELPCWIPFGRRRSTLRIPTRGRADASLCGLCRLSSFEDPSSHGPRRAPKRKRPTKAGLFSPGRGQGFTSRFVPQTNHSLSKEMSGEPRRAEPDLSEILQSLARGPIRSSGGRFFSARS